MTTEAAVPMVPRALRVSPVAVVVVLAASPAAVPAASLAALLAAALTPAFLSVFSVLRWLYAALSEAVMGTPWAAVATVLAWRFS